MKCCINDVNFITLLLLRTELFKFEIQKYGQILCVHKPYFLMPGHIYKDIASNIVPFSWATLRNSYLAILKKYFRKCLTIFEIFENKTFRKFPAIRYICPDL